MADLHRSLVRQLRKCGIDPETGPTTPEEWQRFLARVDATYAQNDDERYTAQRALDISSREMEDLSRQLAADRERLVRMIESLPQALVYTDDDLVIRFANDQASDLLGTVSSGAALAALVDLYDAEGQPVDIRAHVLSGRTESSASVEGHFGIVEAGWSIVPIAVEERLDGVLLVVSDLRDVKAAENALQQARLDAAISRETEAARGRFLANVSHELRTPLNAIIGYGEMLAEEAGGEEQQDLRRILHAAGHLLALINDLLDLSKIDAGRMQLVIGEVPVDALLDAVVATSRPLAHRGGNALEVENGVSGAVLGDPKRLEQCLLNLVGNAAKFTRSGRIRLAARERPDRIELSVTDTGRGIPRERLGHIFEAFEQVRPDEHQGTGLGLAVTRAFVELMGGEIRVESEVGVGSTFTVALPKVSSGP
ncbi:MAG: PAS domain-containing sensor histidine kinase [Alphaproteobacteria bacterium]|nr:PAS domain-containing sensor histidine kinase [Alphaproteobacteria bacterium]